MLSAGRGMPHIQYPAEGLQSSQGKNFEHRMSEDWICATWNVRSMVDTEGPIGVASCMFKRKGRR